MNAPDRPRLAILYPGDRAARDRSDPAESRFANLFEAFSGAGVAAEPVNALYPSAEGGTPPLPGPRLYSDADDPRFQELRRHLEGGWIDLLCAHVGVTPEALPLLWDADFLLGQREDSASVRYVLCEINVSSVAPFPESAIAPLVEATCKALAAVTPCEIRNGIA